MVVSLFSHGFFLPGPPTTGGPGGPGGPWPPHFFPEHATEKFVDNRFNSLLDPMLFYI